MLSTREVIAALSAANPASPLSEERVRRAIRIGTIEPPASVAGRFIWGDQDVVALANALGLDIPRPREEVTNAS